MSIKLEFVRRTRALRVAFVSASWALLSCGALAAATRSLPTSSSLVLTTLVSTTPVHEAQGVAPDETVSFLFSAALDPATVTPLSFVARADGRLQTTFLTLSLDQRTVIVEFPGFMPSESEISVFVDGAVLLDALGINVDVDNDGSPGGRRQLKFSTGPGVKVPGPSRR